MRAKAAELRRRISRSLLSHSFLVRLLVSTLLAALVPLTIMATQQISSESNGVKRTMLLQLDNAAAAVATRMDDCVDSMISVRYKWLIEPKLHESMLASGISAELEAKELMGYYNVALPFAKDYALYSRDLGEAFTAGGKYQANGIASYFLNGSEEAFLSMLDELSGRASFVRQPGDTGTFLYIAPIRMGSAPEISRYALFLITPTSLMETLGSELPEGARVSALAHGDNVFYGNFLTESEEEDGDWLTSSLTSRHGITVQVCMGKSALQQRVEAITASARLLAMLNIGLCMALLVMVVYLNYRPLAQVVNHIRGEDRAEPTPELTSILDYYSDLVNEKGQLTWQLYEKNLLIADRIMENLLSGRKVMPNDLRLLKLNMPFYRVICAPLNQVHDVTGIIERNAIGSPIYTIEMYADNQLALVCGQPDGSAESLRLLAEMVRKLVQSDVLPLGFSNAYAAPERLFLAYLEAGRALNAETNVPNRFSAELNAPQIFLLDESQEDVEGLAQAIATGDEEMLRFAERIFDSLDEHSPSRASQRYVCYQLVDLYRRLGETVGLQLDLEQLSQMLQENSIAVLRERFMKLLTESQQQRQRELTVNVNDDFTCASLMQFISERFSDPAFSMNDVAEHLGVSIYTASRMFKTFIGVNFRKYINDLRVEYARDLLLTTDLSVNEISEQAGFTSSSYFISIFKKAEDMTPSSFRKKHGLPE